MDDTVMIESLSGRRLACMSVTLLLTLLGGFLVGSLVAPEPYVYRNVLGTICVDRYHEPHRWFPVWSVAGGQGTCDKVETVADLMDAGISSDQVIFAFQLPLRRGATNLGFSRWQQNLIGVLQLDIDYSEQFQTLPNAPLTLDVHLGYKNKGDRTDDWTLLAASVEERHLSCEVDPEHAYRYSCGLIPLFELGSLHHDYYLLNLRLLPNMDNERNVGIGKVVDVNLVAIFQNGGFTKVWVSLRTVFFPLVVALLAWFWHRVQSLQRESALIERMLFALGICLSVLNLPLEYLTLCSDMPYMPLITDMRQDIFYCAQLSFWLVFAGERFTIFHGSRLSRYWKHLFAVFFGCASILIPDIAERDVRVTNPFHSIWGLEKDTHYAFAFFIYVCVLASLYMCLLTWIIWRGFCAEKQRQMPSISTTCSPRHHRSSGHCLRFLKLVPLVTLACAVLTVINFILTQLIKSQWTWNDAHIDLYGTSSLLTGVCTMWNVYTMAALFLYAPGDTRRSPAANTTNTVNPEAPINADQQSRKP